MKYFLLRLNPPRPTFANDMSEPEKQVMGQHFSYWARLAEEGRSILYGPVADPAGGWGIAIIAVGDAADATEITAKDPAIKSGLGFHYTTLPMPQVLVARTPKLE